MTNTTTAVVGATGGAGTTRMVVEAATMLARDGRAVAVIDAAYGTQGLADYVAGDVDPDVTALCTDAVDAPLDAGLVDPGWTESGRIALCPARAPFERLARAKTVDAARRFEDRIEEAATRFDHVLVDTPPVAANQAVAAVTACERVVVVAPASTRGDDAAQRTADRLVDLGVTPDAVVATRGTIARADVGVPEFEARSVADAPLSAGGSSRDGAIAEAAAALVDDDLSSVGDERGLIDGVGDYLGT